MKPEGSVADALQFAGVVDERLASEGVPFSKARNGR